MAINTIGPLMLDIEGRSLSDDDRDTLSQPLVGGVILFRRNYRSVVQLTELCAELRKLNAELIIAVDQEGGRVQRFDTPFTPLPALGSIEVIARRMGIPARDLARELGWLMATEVTTVGCDISFAPVLDLDRGNSRVIGDRAFARAPERVIELAGAFIAGMNEAGMAATGKHFPGHGGVVGDSHTECPRDPRPMAELEADLSVFRALATQLTGIMPAHIVYPAVDHNIAGMSPIWLQQILRAEVKFEGVIFSDDLSMQGAAIVDSYPERARRALSAGCDMVLVCNNRVAGKEVLASDAIACEPDAHQRLVRLRATSPKRTWSDVESLQRRRILRQLLLDAG